MAIPTATPFDLKLVLPFSLAVTLTNVWPFSNAIISFSFFLLRVVVGNGISLRSIINTMFETWGEWMLRFAFAGMAGNQVLEWTDLDMEIKIAGPKVREV